MKSGNYFSSDGCVEWGIRLSSIARWWKHAGPGVPGPWRPDVIWFICVREWAPMFSPLVPHYRCRLKQSRTSTFSSFISKATFKMPSLFWRCLSWDSEMLTGSVSVRWAPPVSEALCSDLGRSAAFTPWCAFHKKNPGILKHDRGKNDLGWSLSAHWST